MKILIVHNKDINFYPPVKSLVEILLDLGHSVTIISYDNYGYKNSMNNHANFIFIAFDKFKYCNKKKKIFWKHRFRRYINNVIDDFDIVWTTTDSTISLLGKILLKQNNHIMQLMELVEDTPRLTYKIIYDLHLNKILKIGLNKYANHAKKVVVPEENRAQILRAMWEMKVLPEVLPNKPYNVSLGNPSEIVQEIVNKLKHEDKKIILYQGIFRKERRLDEFADAIKLLGDEYRLCIMGNDSPERRRLCEKYPDIIYVPFIAPPYHLLITGLAHIGILTYYPTANNLPGKLNVLYCAPNKIYEYAYSGLPMIGNDIPGLSQPFEKYNIGRCFDELNAVSIIHAIQEIEKNYKLISENCRKFYNNTDLKKIVSNIIK